MTPRRRRIVWFAIPLLCLVAAGCAPGNASVQRYGSVIGVKAESLPKYKRLHAAVWPEVLAKLKDVNVRNYSIYLAEVKPGEFYLFSYFEYTGTDFEADMAKMAADPTTQKWWDECEPCQQPVPTRKEGEWWHTIDEVFHMD